MRREREAQRHAVRAQFELQKIREARRRHRRSRQAVQEFQLPAIFGDRRRTAVSAAYAKDYGVTFLL